VETPEHEEFCKRFRDNRIELALEKHNAKYLKNQRRSPSESRFSNSYYVYSELATPDEVPGEQMEVATPDELPGKRKKVKLSGRLPGTSVKKTELPPSRPPETAPPSGRSKTNQRRNKRKKTHDNQVISGGRAVSSRIQSSVDTEGEDNKTKPRIALRKPTSVSRTIPVAIPIAQEDADPITTPISRRKSARINESKDSSSFVARSMTRSQSEYCWRMFIRGSTFSDQARRWQEHTRNFYVEQEAKLKMAEEAKSKKSS
jgi:hypothetical protein